MKTSIPIKCVRNGRPITKDNNLDDIKKIYNSWIAKFQLNEIHKLSEELSVSPTILMDEVLKSYAK